MSPAAPVSRARHDLRVLLLAALLAGCGGASPAIEDRPPPADQVELARSAIEREDYLQAIELLRGAIAREPSGEEAGEAHYLLGISHFRRKEWPSAATEFSIVISQFGSDPRVPDARYHLGLSHWRQSRPAPYDQEPTRRAIAEFDRFLSLYPDHPRVDEVREARREARSRLARKAYENGKLYLKMGHPRPARFYFQLVQREYPDTAWAVEAALGEARSWVREQAWERARSKLTELLDASPPEKIAREARELLDRVSEATGSAERG